MEVLAASKIDADGFQLTSKAALDFGSLLVPLRYLLGWRISTLDSFTRGWEDMYFNKSMAQHTTAASQVVTTIDSLHSPRDIPLHMTQAGAATLLRQNGNVLDIADAICSRSNRPLGFVNHHCVHLLLQGLCRAANSCIPRIACNGHFQRFTFQTCCSQRETLHPRHRMIGRVRCGFQPTKHQPWSWPQPQGTYAWQNQNDDGPMSGVGSHVPDSVIGLQSRQTQS